MNQAINYAALSVCAYFKDKLRKFTGSFTQEIKDARDAEIHAKVLENDQFHNEYFVKQGIGRRTVMEAPTTDEQVKQLISHGLDVMSNFKTPVKVTSSKLHLPTEQRRASEPVGEPKLKVGELEFSAWSLGPPRGRLATPPRLDRTHLSRLIHRT